MKIQFKKPKKTILLFLLLIPVLLSIQNRGEFSLTSLSAYNVTNLNRMEIGSTSPIFLGSVGGVSFDQVAEPASGLTINSLNISYNSENPDGQRFNLSINNKIIKVNLFDWLLIPIANYANSPYYSCFTLYGNLIDKEMEDLILNNEGRIMNYHPDLENTLLGLRLFDMDVLILYNFTTDLSKENDLYILGEGETEPDLSKNINGMNTFLKYFDDIQDKLNQTHRSYVITDYTRDISFSITGDSLSISSTPYYYCWRYKEDVPGYDFNNVIQEISDSYNNTLDNMSSGQKDKIIEWLIITSENYEGMYNFYASGTFVDLVALGDDKEGKTTFLNQYTTESLFQLLVETEANMDAMSIIYLKNYSDEISLYPNLLRDINPAIWDATVATMRYSSFFRYIKENYLNEWNNFIGEIESVIINPEVKTPTVMYQTGNIEIENAIQNATSINNANTKLMEVELYPNPSTGLINLNIEIQDYNDLRISIISIDGHVIYTREVKNNIGNINQKIDLSNQPKGLYLIKIENEKLSRIEKLIIK